MCLMVFRLDFGLSDDISVLEVLKHSNLLGFVVVLSYLALRIL